MGEGNGSRRTFREGERERIGDVTGQRRNKKEIGGIKGKYSDKG